jgi:hypothetical protein
MKIARRMNERVIWIAAWLLAFPAISTAQQIAAISGYPVPAFHAEPMGITAGPDGALWFTENSATRSGASPRRG